MWVVLQTMTGVILGCGVVVLVLICCEFNADQNRRKP